MAVGRPREPLLGGQDAVAALGIDVLEEVALVAEQAEAVLHLPGHDEIRGETDLGEGGTEGECGRQGRNGGGQNDAAHETSGKPPGLIGRTRPNQGNGAAAAGRTG